MLNHTLRLENAVRLFHISLPLGRRSLYIALQLYRAERPSRRLSFGARRWDEKNITYRQINASVAVLKRVFAVLLAYQARPV